jgi:hypothetical protein
MARIREQIKLGLSRRENITYWVTSFMVIPHYS